MEKRNRMLTRMERDLEKYGVEEMISHSTIEKHMADLDPPTVSKWIVQTSPTEGRPYIDTAGPVQLPADRYD